MFKKKPQLKAFAPLRSSDRRKIAQGIINTFRIAVPGVEGKESVPQEGRAQNVGDRSKDEAALAALRNSLLPENSAAGKFTTTMGPNLETVTGTVYVGTHQGDVQRPLWVKIDEMMFPTVYTLWKNPTLLPILKTHQPVVEKLYTGADLMIPGLIGPPFPARAIKGSLVAIASQDSPTVPLVVGYAEIEVTQLKSVAGQKGKAVRVLHWYGDEIWGMGGHGAKAPESLEGEHVEEEHEKAEQDDDDGGVLLEDLKIEEGEPSGEASKDMPEKELTTKEIDATFYSAVLYGMHHYLISNNHKSLTFPMSSSIFISTLVLPFLPPASYFNPETGSKSSVHPSLQLKKTSWKNAGKLLKQLDKDQLIQSKTRQGGEMVVLAIDFQDDRVKSFAPYKLPVAAPNNGGGSGNGSSSTQNGPLRVLELHKPTVKLYPIFETAQANTKAFYTSTELKSLFSKYLEAETTAHPNNKRLVKLTPFLANAILSASEAGDSSGFFKRDILTERFISSSSPYHIILRPGETYPHTDLKPRPGVPPRITITTELRQGNKKVTKVSGLEAFRIDPQALADELQRLCASSTSVGQLMGSSPKNPVMEVMVQGPQRTVVQKLLEDKGVPGRWVAVVDKTKKQKGK